MGGEWVVLSVSGRPRAGGRCNGRLRHFNHVRSQMGQALAGRLRPAGRPGQFESGTKIKMPGTPWWERKSQRLLQLDTHTHRTHTPRTHRTHTAHTTDRGRQTEAPFINQRIQQPPVLCLAGGRGQAGSILLLISASF